MIHLNCIGVKYDMIHLKCYGGKYDMIIEEQLLIIWNKLTRLSIENNIKYVGHS